MPRKQSTDDPKPALVGQFFYHAPDMMCIVGKGGRLEKANPAFSQALGYAESELLSRPLLEFVTEEDRPKTIAEIERLEAGDKTEYFENRMRCKSGEKRWISWRFNSADDQLLAIGRDITERKEREQRTASILVAEDNPINQKVIRRIIESLGHNVTVTDNGKNAVDLLRGGKFDLVLMDCHMPVMDGYTATRAIRAFKSARKRETPIIALTADVLKSTRDRCFEVGMNDHVSKPIEQGKLQESIDRFLAANVPVPQIDPATIQKLETLNLPGSSDLVSELIEDFTIKAPKHMSMIRKSLLKGDLPRVSELAHSLKSSAAVLGALNAAEECAKLERAALADAPGEAASAAKRLAGSLKVAMRDLEALAMGRDRRPGAA